MQLKTGSPEISYQVLDIVGSSDYGKDTKILASRTFNMMKSDDWLTGYAGYKKQLATSAEGEGRGIFSSPKANAMIVVTNGDVFSVSLFSTGSDGKKKFTSRKVGQLETTTGDVFIDSNDASQIAICDQVNIYIYNYTTDVFLKAVLPEGFVPGYVAFHNTRFVAPDRASGQWALSQASNGLNWFWGASGEPVIGGIQTKPSVGRAVVRFPGRSDQLLVLGETGCEMWVDVGGALFPYQKNTSTSFDYGCVNPATVATSEEFVAWIGSNSESEAVLMFTNGAEVKTISTDGINNKLQRIVNPLKATALFVKIYGHLIYQVTFYDKKDNWSFMYDFTTNKFFDLTDENMDFHIARDIAFFKGEYYFVSLRDANMYLMSSDLSTYDYGDGNIKEIPRIRVCSNFRLPNSKGFKVPIATFTVEQGNDPENVIGRDDYKPRIGMSISRDGGLSYGSYEDRHLNLSGNRKNILDWNKLGYANDFVAQFRFWGRGQWNAFDGVIGVYQ